jgi:acetate kinase
MKMLVANVGSSSLKCQLLDMPAEKVLTKVKVERVGEAQSPVEWLDRHGQTRKASPALPNPVAAIRFVLNRLIDPADGVFNNLRELDAVAFKPLCARGRITGAQYMTDDVLAAMADFSEYIAPMHNESCIRAVKCFREVLPETPMVGLFETFFVQSWPECARIYSIPWDWTQKYDVRRSMGHSCSHFYVNRRVAELIGRQPGNFNAVQLHLGGSSSLVAVKTGQTIDGTGSFTMQAGPPMSVRSSDMDGFLIAYLWSKGEGSPKQIVDRMMTEAGLAGISGIGFDMRDLLAAAERGHERARLAVDTYVYQIRKYLGSFLLVLGHTDVITFAAGTGETSPEIREQILRDTEELGIRLDPDRNAKCIRREGLISSDDSRIQVWVVPTNEEIIVARECAKLLGVCRKE